MMATALPMCARLAVYRDVPTEMRMPHWSPVCAGVAPLGAAPRPADPPARCAVSAAGRRAPRMGTRTRGVCCGAAPAAAAAGPPVAAAGASAPVPALKGRAAQPGLRRPLLLPGRLDGPALPVAACWCCSCCCSLSAGCCCCSACCLGAPPGPQLFLVMTCLMREVGTAAPRCAAPLAAGAAAAAAVEPARLRLLRLPARTRSLEASSASSFPSASASSSSSASSSAKSSSSSSASPLVSRLQGGFERGKERKAVSRLCTSRMLHTTQQALPKEAALPSRLNSKTQLTGQPS